jgi:SAM-dependent methyltransferase
MTLLGSIRQFLLRFTGAVSSDYRPLGEEQPPDGWRDSMIAQRQKEAYAPLLRDLRRGAPRADFVTAANAVRACGIASPSLLEIGCGSGYYSEVFSTLVGPLRYTGVDYSASMLALACADYPSERFVLADAAHLPFADGSFDIGLSGNSLMHIPDYAGAIAETARVSKRWCIFHSVPVIDHGPTARMRKKAYGVDVFEATFQTGELESLFREASLTVRSVEDSLPYDLSFVLGEHSRSVTFVCEKA